jgi:hypothetical protein
MVEHLTFAGRRMQQGLDYCGALEENVENNYLDGKDIRVVVWIHTGVITLNVTHINN